MGAGGIGGVATAALTEAGHDVVAVSTNAEIRAAIERAQLRLRVVVCAHAFAVC